MAGSRRLAWLQLDEQTKANVVKSVLGSAKLRKPARWHVFMMCSGVDAEAFCPPCLESVGLVPRALRQQQAGVPSVRSDHFCPDALKAFLRGVDDLPARRNLHRHAVHFLAWLRAVWGSLGQHREGAPTMLDAILESQRSWRRCSVPLIRRGHLHGLLVLAVDDVDPVCMPKRPVGHVPPKDPQLFDASTSFWSSAFPSPLIP